MKLKNIPFFEKTTRPLLIAGPCSAESEEQLLAVAHALKGKEVFCSGPEYGNHAHVPDVLRV